MIILEDKFHIMFKLYSKGCQYALLALTAATARGGRERFQAKEICEIAEIPEPLTRKVLQSLVQGGFLEAHRGPGGGYTLTRNPAEITLLEVIRAVEGEETFNHCVLGFPECGKANPCPMHEMWVNTKKGLLQQLSSVTLQELTQKRLKQKHAAEPRLKRKSAP